MVSKRVFSMEIHMTLGELITKTLGEQRITAIAKSRSYRWLVDGVANNVFSQIYILNEHFIAGLTWGQALQVRVAAFFGNMVTGGPYGDWQDFVREKFGITTESHPFRKYVADVAAFTTGQSPIYAAYLAAPVLAAEMYQAFQDRDFGRALDAYQQVDWARVKEGVAFLTLAAPALGRPQGITYNFVRRRMGIKGD
jgi:hypothetical protein